MKSLKRCEASDKLIECGRKAKYLIKDIVCDDHKPFPVCSKCFKLFIKKGEKNPHYKLVRKFRRGFPAEFNSTEVKKNGKQN